MRSNVDLPQPDGPTTVTNSSDRTANVTSCTAWVPSGNTIETWSKRSATSASESGAAGGPATGWTTRVAVSDSDIMLL